MISRMNAAGREPAAAPVDRRTAWKIVLSVVVVVGSVSTLLYASMKEEIQLFQSVGTIQPGEVSLNWVNSDIRQQALELLGPEKK